MDLTGYSDAELMAASPVYWCPLIEMKLLHPVKGLIPWEFYPYQLAFLADTSQFRIIVKSRQVGMSQTVALEALHTAVFQPGATILFISRKEDLAINLLKYVRDLLQSVPPEQMGGKLVMDNQLEIQFSNGSRIKSESASEGAARGFAGTSLYLDEAAWMQYAETIYQSALPAASLGGRMTLLSTPYGRSGMGGFFYRMWSSTQGNTYSKHRIPWYRCPPYNPEGYLLPDAHQARAVGMLGEWYKRMRPAFAMEQWASEYECLAAGVPVFVRGKGFIPVEQVCCGDYVLGSRGQWVKVLGVKSKPATSIYEISLPLGSSLRVTGNHPIWADGEFRHASTLTPGMLVTRPQPQGESVQHPPFDLAHFANGRAVEFDGSLIRIQNHNATWHKRYIPWNADLGTLIGLYAAEGCQSANHRAATFSFAAEETDLAELCVAVIHNLFGVEAKTRVDGPVRRVTVNSVFVACFLKTLVPGIAINKTIHPDLLDSSSEVATALLHAMLDGDGCQTASCIVYRSSSIGLASAVWYLLARAGYAANYRQACYEALQVINGRTVTVRDAWDVRVYTRTRYQEIVIGTKPMRSTAIGQALPVDNGWELKIKDVQEVPYNGLVYNIDTDDDSTFCAAGIVTHNCDFVLSGTSFFSDAYIDKMAVGWNGLQMPRSDRRYVKAWDIGRHNDPTVCFVADITDLEMHPEIPTQIVHFERNPGLTYEQIIERIYSVHQQYPGWTYVESNGPGDAVLDMLWAKTGTADIEGYHMSVKRKVQALDAYKLLMERELIKCGVPKLLEETKIYTLPDDNLQQDCVMSMAILARQLVTPGSTGGWIIGKRVSE